MALENRFKARPVREMTRAGIYLIGAVNGLVMDFPVQPSARRRYCRVECQGRPTIRRESGLRHLYGSHVTR